MTPEQWKKAETQLKRKISALKKKLKAPASLADKIIVKSAILKTENALRDHRLNQYELTANETPEETETDAYFKLLSGGA